MLINDRAVFFYPNSRTDCLLERSTANSELAMVVLVLDGAEAQGLNERLGCDFSSS